MGFLGKLFVVLFAASSLAALTWAFGIYTQRIVWTSAGQETPGLLDQQYTKANELGANADRAFTRWSGNLATVRNLEAQRQPRRSFYALELYQIRTGQAWDGRGFSDTATPVREMVNAPNGYLDVRPNAPRQPVLVRAGGQPLQSVVAYDRINAKLAKDIADSQASNVKAIDERAKLTDEIVGLKVPKLVKGLRQLITEQKEIKTEADNESGYASDFVTNLEAEFGLLKKRRDAMVSRMSELDKRPETGSGK